MRRVMWTTRRFVLIVMAMILLGAVNSAHAEIIRFTCNLSGDKEVPPVLTGSFGTAVVTLDTDTRTVTWTVTVFNMPSGTTVSHFHVGGPTHAGPTVVDFTVSPNISNDYSFSGSANALSNARPAQGIGSWEDFIQSLLGGQIYINVHSAVNPGGEIRGPVFRVQ